MSYFHMSAHLFCLNACSFLSLRMVFLLVLLIFTSVGVLRGQDDYRGQDISGDDLSEQDLTGALFDNTTIFSDGINGVNLSNTTGNGAYLAEQDLSGVDFRGVNLTGVNLYNADLTGATFDNTTIFTDGFSIGANLSNDFGTGAYLGGLDLGFLDLRSVNLSGVNFTDANLSNAQIDNTTIFSNGTVGVNLSGTNANLSNLDLSDVDFRGVNLNTTTLSGSNLIGTNFTDTQLSDTNLSSAQYNSFTIWPVNYEADAQGAIRTDQNFHDYLNELVSSTYQESNESGVSAALSDPNSYDLYRQEDGSLVEANTTNQNYQSGYNDVYNAFYDTIRENPRDYGLFSEQDRNKTILNESTRVLVKLQAEFAMEGMSLVSYQEKMFDSNATQTKDWYYQPENGWSWTNRSVYPYLFVNQENGEGNQTLSDRWLYHNQTGPKDYLFYDFNTQGWINPF